ncbi:MAG: hypothetical protein HY286_03120 [Planctomycetes bacterium]|nr:hypothetical protein [Planctomycetota bacterium]
MPEQIRPCLRCDGTLTNSEFYCSTCGTFSGRHAYVTPRPAAAAPRTELNALANVLDKGLRAGAILSIAIVGALFASLIL